MVLLSNEYYYIKRRRRGEDSMKSLTIITPTYNRVELLPRCYESLRTQTSSDFEWIIIDDGSSDGTKELVEKWIKDPERTISIEYHWKENGGKHTALNASHPFIHGKYVLILDSDDYLLPVAVETVCITWNEFYSDKQIGCISFYKSLEDGTIVSKQIKSRVVGDHLSLRVNQKGGGDQCETVRSEYFMEYIFPVYPGEKFISEGLLWNYIGFKYKTVYCNESIYICEYMPGGISKSGRALLMRNPKGMIELTKTFFDSRVCMKKRIKETWLYIVYSLCDKRSFRAIIADSGQRLLTVSQLPAGVCLYCYWKNKYLRG